MVAASVDLEMPSASKACTMPPPYLASNVSHVTSKSEPAVSWNGWHTPLNLKPKLNLSIEVPSASQVKFVFLRQFYKEQAELFPFFLNTSFFL